MALPFLNETDITHSVNILHHLYHFLGQGVRGDVNLGLSIARGEMAAALHSYLWDKTGGDILHLLSPDKTLIQHFHQTTDWSARGAAAVFQ